MNTDLELNTTTCLASGVKHGFITKIKGAFKAIATTLKPHIEHFLDSLYTTIASVCHATKDTLVKFVVNFLHTSGKDVLGETTADMLAKLAEMAGKEADAKIDQAIVALDKLDDGLVDKVEGMLHTTGDTTTVMETLV